MLNNTSYTTGLVLYAFSAFVFCGTIDGLTDNSAFFTESFFLCYFSFIAYLIVVFVTNKRRHSKFFAFKSLSNNILLLLLANISAFALNREIAIFQISTNWLAIFFGLLNAGLLWFSWQKDYRAKPLNFILVSLFTSGALLGLYGVFYVLPFTFQSILLCWFFGFTLHTLVPLFWTLLLGKIVFKFLKVNPLFKYSIIVGVAFPIILAIGFTAKWNAINYQIKQVYEASQVPLKDKELPQWVALSRHLEKGMMTEKILKSRIVYEVADVSGDWFWSGGGGGMLNEVRKHDPFVVIASFFSHPLNMERSEKIKLLQSIFNQRHQTERKLWSGEDLITKNILTNVQLFPEYRMAYTEKTIDIENESEHRWRRRNQEALYSFYLPEGSVVTSASLWVEGIERPSFLTTKGKADSAYTTIVGREMRDPLLIHWQEGSKVTVRVFPVSFDNPRKFKIGVTSPLKYDNGDLVYENLDFDGPPSYQAKENIHVVVTGQLDKINTPLNIEQKGDYWVYNGHYQSDWSLQFPAPELATKAFSFQGKSYQLMTQSQSLEAFSPTEIYLDINQSWSKRQFNQIWESVKDKDVYVYQDKLLKLTEGNRKRLFQELKSWNYNLFPFHKIKSPNDALVITQNDHLTPVLDDLKDTKFSKNLNSFLLTNNSPIKVFNIQETLTPYLKTLKELRTINLQSGDIHALIELIKNEQFKALEEDDITVSLAQARVNIIEGDHALENTVAPDHLLRLFAYNNLMKQIGKDYFNKELLEDELIGQAEKAFVVSPVSSLVVLETQADYERFDIKQSKDGLTNAMINDAGSVPEPHEWVLIIFCLIVGWFLFMKSKL